MRCTNTGGACYLESDKHKPDLHLWVFVSVKYLRLPPEECFNVSYLNLD